jgi:DNA modification methylase
MFTESQETVEALPRGFDQILSPGSAGSTPDNTPEGDSTDYENMPKDLLIRILRRRDVDRALGLVWERSDIQHEAALMDTFPVPQLLPDLCIGTAPFQDLIIEGDNFDALKMLTLTHRGRVKFIYIDPPYNTGNRDFVYLDRYVGKTDRYRHSMWLEFTYRRLLMAKELLSDDGLIFISIDDIEGARLKVLCDQVFGDGRHMATLVWQTDGNFDNQAKFKVCHEYIHVYAKDPAKVPSPAVIDPNVEETAKLFRDEIRNTIVKNGPKNPICDLLLPAGFPADFEDGTIPARFDAWPHYDRDVAVRGSQLQEAVVARSGWANRRLCELFIAQEFKPVIDTKGQRTRFVLTRSGAIENVKDRSSQQSHVVSVIRNVGTVQKASQELSEAGIQFTYPKPTGLLKYLLKMVPGNDFLVLDFFAGSGTMAEAVMALNAEDGGMRRFIMVSHPESVGRTDGRNLCRDILRERIAAASRRDLPCSAAYLALTSCPTTRMLRHLDDGASLIYACLLGGVPLVHPEAGGTLVSHGDRHVAYGRPFDNAFADRLNALPSSGHLTVATWTPALAQALLWRQAAVVSLPMELDRRFSTLSISTAADGSIP